MSKATFAAGVLTKALKQASALTARDGSIPILGTVAIEVGEAGARFRATDLDAEIEVHAAMMAANGDALGFCVAPKAVLPLIQGLPADWPVTVSVATCLSLDWGAGAARFPIMPLADFPAFEGGTDDVAALDVPEKGLAALDAVLPCVSSEETRYYLNGVCLTGPNATLVATDGHRLAAVGTGWGEYSQALELIVPRRTCQVWRSLFAKPAHRIETASRGSQRRIEFKADGLTLRSKTIDGKFPDWRRVVPKPSPATEFAVTRTALIAALQAAIAWLRGQGYRSCGVCLVVGGGAAYLAADRGGDTFVRFDLGGSVGADTWFAVNGRYLLDMLRRAGGTDLVKFQQGGEGNPIRIIASASDDDAFVVMPLRESFPSRALERSEPKQVRAA